MIIQVDRNTVLGEMEPNLPYVTLLRRLLTYHDTEVPSVF